MKRITTLFLALLMCLSVPALADVHGNIEFPLTEEPVELTVWTEQLASVENFDTNYMTQWYEEMTNVHINWITVPTAERKTKLNLSLASGDYPDIYGGDFDAVEMSQYGGSVFIPLNDLLDAGYMPNTQQWFEDMPELKEALTAPDGNLYGFPRAALTYNIRVTKRAYVNADWLDQYTEATGNAAPETTEAFKEMLIYFRDNDMNGNGDTTDEVPLMGSNSAWEGNPLYYLMSAFIHPGNGNHMLATDGVVTYQAAQDGWREGLKYMNELYTEGLLAAETYIQDATQYMALVSSGVVGVATGAWQGVFTDNTVVPYTDYAVLLPLEGPDGLRMTVTDSINGICSMGFKGAITVACEHPEIAAQWLDFWLSTEGTTTIQKGFEGVTYEIVDEVAISGAPQSMKMLVDSAVANTGAQNLMWKNKTVPERVTPEIYYGVAYVEGSSDVELYEGAKAYMPFESWTGFPLIAWASDASMQTEVIELTALINDYVNQSVAEFVMGGRDIDDDAQWQEYLDELDAMGVDRLVELTQIINFGE